MFANYFLSQLVLWDFCIWIAWSTRSSWKIIFRRFGRRFPHFFEESFLSNITWVRIEDVSWLHLEQIKIFKLRKLSRSLLVEFYMNRVLNCLKFQTSLALHSKGRSAARFHLDDIKAINIESSEHNESAEVLFSTLNYSFREIFISTDGFLWKKWRIYVGSNQIL